MGDDAALPPPSPAAGWYPDPDKPGQRRYFDGKQWTSDKPKTVGTRTFVWMAVAYTLAGAFFLYAIWPYGWWPL